jgi:hypothetical protein
MVRKYAMRVGRPSTASLLIFAGIACGSDHTGHDASPLERSIATSIGGRLGVPVVARCVGLVACVTLLPDGDRIPIVTWPTSHGEWEWRVDGLLVASDTLELYLRDVVNELGAPQEVKCAPKLRRIAPGDRVECWLAHGGKAFVTVRADGSTSVEVELDKTAADARSEVVTPARDDEMTKTSRALANEEGDEDDGDEVAPVDAAVQSAP